jgi:hypothetical protein
MLECRNSDETLSLKPCGTFCPVLRGVSCSLNLEFDEILSLLLQPFIPC